MPSLVDECLLGKNKFKNFLEVIEDCGIKTGYDFIHFMSVAKEHCIDKGITDYDEVKKIWKEHKESIKQVIENSKKSNIIGVFIDKDGNKTPIMKIPGLFPEDMFGNGQQVKVGNLYADKETYEWLTTPSDEDDDIGDWRENTVFTDELDPERVKACKKIFEGIDKVEVKKENIDD